MADTAITTNLSRDGKASLSNTSKIELNYNDTLTIRIGTNFPANSQITVVEFFNVVNGGNGGKLLGCWKRDGTGIIAAGLSATARGNGVTITDVDAGNEDDDYYYKVWAGAYPADPELLARKRRPAAQQARRTPEVEL